MFQLRPMTVADFDEVSQLWAASAGLGVCGAFDQFCRFLQRNPGMSPVATADGRVVGAVHCGEDGFRGYLYHLAVDARYQGRGIARELIDWCAARLAANGIERCSIFLYVQNDEGEKFWRRIGWRERVDLKVFATDLD